MDLDRRADEIFAAYAGDGPGCAAGVFRGDEVLLARGYGLASLEHGVAIGPETVFDVASASKQFTAACALLLEREGRLSLGDDVRRHVRELPDYGRTVTLLHLLYHTSGLPNYIHLLQADGRRSDDVVTEAEAMRRLVRERRLVSAPGTRFRYNDTGYLLLSVVLRRVSGRTLRELAAERIFGPLGMESTRVRDDHTEVVARRAEGYAPRGAGAFRICASNWETTGDGAVHGTIQDLARWSHRFFEAHALGSDPPLRMQRRGRLDGGAEVPYGMGLFVGEHRGKPAVWHEGEWAGFRAELIRLPEHRLAAAVLANRSDADAPRLARRLLDAALEAG